MTDFHEDWRPKTEHRVGYSPAVLLAKDRREAPLDAPFLSQETARISRVLHHKDDGRAAPKPALRDPGDQAAARTTRLREVRSANPEAAFHVVNRSPAPVLVGIPDLPAGPPLPSRLPPVRPDLGTPAVRRGWPHGHSFAGGPGSRAVQGDDGASRRDVDAAA